MTVLSTHDLHKTFGRITAVNRLSLEVPEGTVFGLLGPNGSGKTTTLGMVLGVTEATSGSFYWFGEKSSHQVRKKVGSILEKPNFYPSFSAYKNLQLACKIKEVKENRIDEVLDQVDLLGRKNDPFKTYSLGMKQRLAIASALLAHPKVLILDEPTNGLDPKGIAEIRQLIIDIGQTGKTIILASHLLDEVQKVCSDFAILKSGSLVYKGKVNTDFNDEVRMELGAENTRMLVESLPHFPAYLSHTLLGDRIELRCNPSAKAEELNKFLTNSGIYLNHLKTVQKTLEQQFLEILEQDNG